MHNVMQFTLQKYNNHKETTPKKHDMGQNGILKTKMLMTLNQDNFNG
jgi:hypothetical protein